MRYVFSKMQSGPSGGDCTAPYSIRLHGNVTVREFIEAVLENKNEWGYVEVVKGKSKSAFDSRLTVGFRHGELENGLPENKLLDRKVKSASASGGFSRMDYCLYV